MTISELAGHIDAVMDRAKTQSAADGKPVTCRAGCFFCCKEPVFAEEREVFWLLESMSEHERTVLTLRTGIWLAKFLSSGLIGEERPDAHVYRAKLLWCPLLDSTSGLCRVYDRRPVECRLFMTFMDPGGCADDERRRHQKFMDVPELNGSIAGQKMRDLWAGERIYFDHLGILLARALCGYTGHSKAGFIIERSKTKSDEFLKTWDLPPSPARASDDPGAGVMARPFTAGEASDS